MSPLHLFHWLAETHLGIFMRDSTWAFAIVEIIHLLTLAVFGGAILIVNIRLLGLGFKSQPASEVARDLLPITIIGLVLMSITGYLLTVSGPMRYFYNTPFRTKLTLFVIALFYQLILQFTLARKIENATAAATNYRVAGAISLFLWGSIGIAGRAIGYF